MKGISPLIEALILIVIAIALSTIIGSWLSTFSVEKAATIENTTSQQLQCRFGNIFIKSASYNCSGNCAQGAAHNLTVQVVNTGKISAEINRLFIQNTTGTVFQFDVSTIIINPGTTATLSNISTGTCNGINRTIEKIIVSTSNCPNTAFNSIPGNDVTYVSC
jgi:hypothetical protein